MCRRASGCWPRRGPTSRSRTSPAAGHVGPGLRAGPARRTCTAGRFVTEGLPRGSKGGVAAVRATRTGEEDFFEIASPEVWQHGLFAFHPDSHLHVTYKMDRPNWVNVFVIARGAGPNGRARRQLPVQRRRVLRAARPGQWRTVSIPLAKLRRAGIDSDAAPGRRRGSVPGRVQFPGRPRAGDRPRVGDARRAGGRASTRTSSERPENRHEDSACFSWLLAAAAAGAADWPQFRGPDRSGVSKETGLPLEWSATKNIVWKTPLPGPGQLQPDRLRRPRLRDVLLRLRAGRSGQIS